MCPVPSKGSPSTAAASVVSRDPVQSLRINEEDAYHRNYIASRLCHYNNLITRSRRLTSPQRLRAKAIIKSYTTQLSGDSPFKDFEGVSEDSPYVKGTTLLKPLPHNGIDKDEEDEIVAEINKLQLDDGDQHFFDHLYSILKLTGVRTCENSISVGPVLQLMSVRISNKSDGIVGNDLEIFGEISVTDNNKNIFYLYKRERDNPDLVTSDWNYLHVNGCPTAPVMWGKMKCNLSNKDGLNFEGEYDVEKLVVDDEEKTVVTCFGKDGYSALLEFSKMNYAVVIEVFMYLTYDPPPTGDKTFQLHGTIKVNKILCFKRDEDHPMVMTHDESGNSFSQFRNVFAVSVFSPWIDVEVELFSGGIKIVDETIKHHCYGLTSQASIMDFRCQNKRCTFSMDVQWLSHVDFFGSGGWTSELNVIWSSDAFPIVQVGELKTAVKSKKFKKSMKRDCIFVEVFSVFIGGGDSSVPLSLCGTVVVRDREGPVYIFCRNRKRPDKLLSLSKQELGGRVLSLAWPDRWLQQKDFYMHLKLKNCQGNQVCRGGFEMFESICRWHDPRMCSFIRGENGYFAAVHYSAFSNGKKAKVSIKWEGHYSVVVCGSVFAEYSNYDYPSTYEKENYRSIIFKRSRKDGVRVKGRLEIPLSKSHVSAPSDCEGLIVYVKLWYPPILDDLTEKCSIDAKLLFKASSMFATEVLGPFSVKVQWE